MNIPTHVLVSALAMNRTEVTEHSNVTLKSVSGHIVILKKCEVIIWQ